MVREYSAIVLKHFFEPSHFQRIEDADRIGIAGKVEDGDYFEFSAQLTGDTIERIGFQTIGCAPAIAAGSLLSQELEGKRIADVLGWNVERLLDAMGGLPEEKTFCARIAIQALHKLTNKVTKEGRYL